MMFEKMTGHYESLYHSACLTPRDLDKAFSMRLWMNWTLRNLWQLGRWGKRGKVHSKKKKGKNMAECS